MTKVLMALKTQNLKNDQRVLKEINSLTKHGADVEVFVAKNCNMTQDQLGFPMHNVSIVGGAATTNIIFQLIGVLQFYIKFFLFIWNKKYDKFWICDPIMFGLVGLSKILKKKTTIIWDHHELPPGWFLKNKALMYFFRRAYLKADIVIHTNESRKNYLEEMLGCKATRSYIISNYPDSLNLNSDKLDDLSEEWMLQNNKFVYLQNSLQENRCGQQAISAAIALGYKVFHAGKTNHDYIEKYNLGSEDLYCAGYLSVSQINRVLEKCSFTIILYKKTSLNQTFCDANRLYQAMSLGVPIVHGNNPTLVDATQDYINSIYLAGDGSDRQTIEIAISKLLNGISERQPKHFYWSSYDYIFDQVVRQ